MTALCERDDDSTHAQFTVSTVHIFLELKVHSVHVWSTVTMEILIILMCISFLLPVQPKDTDRCK